MEGYLLSGIGDGFAHLIVFGATSSFILKNALNSSDVFEKTSLIGIEKVWHFNFNINANEWSFHFM